MKALRYLLIAVVMVSFLSVSAQGLAQRPQTEFRSTSVMAGTGSTLPLAAQQGAMVTGNTPGSYSPATPGHIRRAKQEDPDPFGDETIGGTTNPNEPGTPIGDGLWALMLLAGAFAFVRVFLKKKTRVGTLNG